MDTAETRIVDCPRCQARVQATVVACDENLIITGGTEAEGIEQYHKPAPEPHSDYRVWLLRCQICKHTLVTWDEDIEFDGGYGSGNIDVWWPGHQCCADNDNLEQFTGAPPVVRISLLEAQRCLKSGSYTASVVMSGRATEGICRHFGTRSRYLGPGLPELLERGVIDRPLFEWGQELHEHRNMAAHASEEELSEEVAADLLDFAVAICNYVFVLKPRFERFMQRKKDRHPGDAPETPGMVH